MYRTPLGERILVGAEKRLFEASLAMMVDYLSDDDWEFDVPQFDALQRGQKLFALYRVTKALFLPEEPPPELTAFIEATVAAVYWHALDSVIEEIDRTESAEHNFAWRRLVREAARQDHDIEDIPDEDSSNHSDWKLTLECLEERVLWDNDFADQDGLDADPDVNQNVKLVLGISDDYHTAVAHDPPDDQISLYVDALKGLTRHERGAGNKLDES